MDDIFPRNHRDTYPFIKTVSTQIVVAYKSPLRRVIVWTWLFPKSLYNIISYYCNPDYTWNMSAAEQHYERPDLPAVTKIYMPKFKHRKQKRSTRSRVRVWWELEWTTTRGVALDVKSMLFKSAAGVGISIIRPEPK